MTIVVSWGERYGFGVRTASVFAGEWPVLRRWDFAVAGRWHGMGGVDEGFELKGFGLVLPPEGEVQGLGQEGVGGGGGGPFGVGLLVGEGGDFEGEGASQEGVGDGGVGAGAGAGGGDALEFGPALAAVVEEIGDLMDVVGVGVGGGGEDDGGIALENEAGLAEFGGGGEGEGGGVVGQGGGVGAGELTTERAEDGAGAPGALQAFGLGVVGRQYRAQEHGQDDGGQGAKG